MAKRKRRTLWYTDERRRAQQTRQTLPPAAIAKAGQVGLGETAQKLAGKPKLKHKRNK